MNNIGLYIDFFEGTLDPLEERKFAENFAIDADLRAEFRKYVVLTKALETSSDNYTPPIESKNAVFAALGITSSTALATDPIPTQVNIPKKPSFFMGRFFTALTTGIVTLALSLLGYTQYPFFSSNKELKHLGNAESGFSTGSNNQIDLSKSSGIANKVIQKDKAQDPKQTLYAMNNRQETVSDISTDKDEPPSAEVSIASIQSEIPPSTYMQKNISSVNSQIASNYQPLFDTCFFIRKYDSRFRFEFKNTPSWFAKSPTIQPYQLNNFNNLSVTILYPLYKTLILGADFRQETFYVEYTGTNEQGRNLTYHQQPNLSTFSLLLRYTPFDFTENFRPFGQLLLGGNKTGVISREMIGLEYYPFEYVFFLLGAELNQFYFTHNSKWFNSSKYSLNYGMGVKF